MVPTNINCTALNIEATIPKHIEKAYFIQPLHALIWFKTVIAVHGRWKVKAVHALSIGVYPKI